MQNAERRTQNAERRTQNAERRTQNAERRMQNAERRTQNAERRMQTIKDSQLCCLRFDGIVEEDTTMCLLDEGDHRSP